MMDRVSRKSACSIESPPHLTVYENIDINDVRKEKIVGSLMQPIVSGNEFSAFELVHHPE